MKRLTPEQKAYQIRRQRFEQNKRQRRTGRHRHALAYVRKLGRNRLIMTMPERCSLFSELNCEVLLRTGEELEQILVSERQVILDFRQTTRMTASAALYIHSIVSYARMTGNFHGRVSVWGSKAPGVRHLMHRASFLSTEDMISETFPEGFVPVCTSDVGEHLQRLIRSIEASLYGKTIHDEEEMARLFGAVSEAVLNVIQHAYPEDGLGAVEKRTRWWLIGQRVEDQLFIALIDRGIGIPETLPKADFWEQLELTFQRFVGTGHDCAMIRAAMERGRSRAEKPGRGHGLEDVLKFVSENPRGELWVFSNHGMFHFESKSGEISIRENKRNLNGTMIQWNVSLPERAGERTIVGKQSEHYPYGNDGSTGDEDDH